MRVQTQVAKANEAMGLTKEWSDSARDAAVEARSRGAKASAHEDQAERHGRMAANYRAGKGGGGAGPKESAYRASGHEAAQQAHLRAAQAQRDGQENADKLSEKADAATKETTRRAYRNAPKDEPKESEERGMHARPRRTVDEPKESEERGL